MKTRWMSLVFATSFCCVIFSPRCHVHGQWPWSGGGGGVIQSVTGGFKHAGGVASGATHHAGGVASSATHHAGQIVSGGTHHAGGVLSEATHHVGKVVSGGTHHTGKMVSGATHHLGGLASGGAHHTGGVASSITHHVGGVGSAITHHVGGAESNLLHSAFTSKAIGSTAHSLSGAGMPITNLQGSLNQTPFPHASLGNGMTWTFDGQNYHAYPLGYFAKGRIGIDGHGAYYEIGARNETYEQLAFEAAAAVEGIPTTASGAGDGVVQSVRWNAMQQIPFKEILKTRQLRLLGIMRISIQVVRAHC